MARHGRHLGFVVLACALAAPPAAVASTATDDVVETESTGRLRAVWYEDPRDPSQPSRIVADLELGGRVSRVELDSGAVGRAGGLRALVGEEVLLRREAAAAAAGGAWSAAVVSASKAATPPSAVVRGNLKWVNLLCKFSDVADEPHPIDDYRQLLGSDFPRLGHYWKEASFGIADVAGSETAGWFTLPQPRSFYFVDDNLVKIVDLARDCAAAADAAFDFRRFYGINVFLNAQANAAFGGAMVLDLDGEQRVWATTWLPVWASNALGAVAHEMGHGFGLPHANNSDGDSNPYDNPWDLMSNVSRWAIPSDAYGVLPKQTNVEHKRMLGWIPDPHTLAPGSSGSYDFSLVDVSVADPAGAYRMLRVPTADGHHLVAEARTPQGYDAALELAPGIVLYDVFAARPEPVWLVDGDTPPNGHGVTEGTVWRAGESLSWTRQSIFDASGTLEVLSSTGSTMQARLSFGAPETLSRLPAAAAGRDFGSALSLDGDRLAVASRGDADVELYRRAPSEPGGWVRLATLPRSGFSGLTAVSLDGDRLAVGFPFEDVVVLYERAPGSGEHWNQVAQIANPEPSVPHFGLAVALSGDTLAVSANSDGNSGRAGVVHVFEKGNAWTRTTRLGSTATVDGPFDGFGHALALDGSSLVVGAPADDIGRDGLVYVYESTAPAIWSLQKRLGDPSSGVTARWSLGSAVDLRGNRLAFTTGGSYGAGRSIVYVYERADAGSAWQPAAQIEQVMYPVGVALGDDLLAAPADGAVRVYAYDRETAGWRLLAAPPATDPVHALAAGAAGVVAGEPFADVAGEDSGRVETWNRFCEPGPTSLCTLGGRFELRLRWRTATGEGDGRAVSLTDNTGYFWFFSPENVEVVVKVLDACGVAGANNFWVFAVGLTDQEVRMTVVDTWTGEVVDIVNPLSTGFAPFFQTAAFKRSCTAPVGRLVATSTRQLATTPEAPPAAAPPAANCVSSPTALCLSNGRYSVEGTWATSTASGSANVVALTADTGYLWFFAPENVEVVVKVLDACSFYDSHWVFASGLTDQEVRLEVTDTTTGAVREWTNPRGTSFVPVRDTDAFPHSCP